MMLRRTLAAGAAFLWLGVASPAVAHLVEVTTSVSLANPGDNTERDVTELQDALRLAVADVLREAIAFKPTLIVLTAARVVGDRLYVRLLIADQDGERIVDELHGEMPAQTVPDEPI
jgi:hypothetical protein